MVLYFPAALTKDLNMHFDMFAAYQKLIILSCFSLQKFDKEPHYALLKELFTQVCDVRCFICLKAE